MLRALLEVIDAFHAVLVKLLVSLLPKIQFFLQVGNRSLVVEDLLLKQANPSKLSLQIAETLP